VRLFALLKFCASGVVLAFLAGVPDFKQLAAVAVSASSASKLMLLLTCIVIFGKSPPQALM
jgi:hypothetical protein